MDLIRATSNLTGVEAQAAPRCDLAEVGFAEDSGEDNDDEEEEAHKLVTNGQATKSAEIYELKRMLRNMEQRNTSQDAVLTEIQIQLRDQAKLLADLGRHGGEAPSPR